MARERGRGGQACMAQGEGGGSGLYGPGEGERGSGLYGPGRGRRGQACMAQGEGGGVSGLYGPGEGERGSGLYGPGRGRRGQACMARGEGRGGQACMARGGERGPGVYDPGEKGSGLYGPGGGERGPPDIPTYFRGILTLLSYYNKIHTYRLVFRGNTTFTYVRSPCVLCLIATRREDFFATVRIFAACII